MRGRRVFNPKRRICDETEARARLEALHDAGALPSYGGNPEHKRSPGISAWTRKFLAPGKTLCDAVRIHTRARALELLSEGFSRGLFSVQARGSGLRTCGRLRMKEIRSKHNWKARAAITAIRCQTATHFVKRF